MTDQPPPTDIFTLPPQGSMDPLSYWRLLYQREQAILFHLSNNGNSGLTAQQENSIAALRHARIATTSSQMPARGGMNKAAWIRVLEHEIRILYAPRPGAMERTTEVLARMGDYEMALRMARDGADMESD